MDEETENFSNSRARVSKSPGEIGEKGERGRNSK